MLSHQAASILGNGLALTCKLREYHLLFFSEIFDFLPCCKTKIEGASGKVRCRKNTLSTQDSESSWSQLLTVHTKQHCTESSSDNYVPRSQSVFQESACNALQLSLTTTRTNKLFTNWGHCWSSRENQVNFSRNFIKILSWKDQDITAYKDTDNGQWDPLC